jgi:hypothetical protein
MQLSLTLADRFGRVGGGPFPTEAIDEWGEKLQTIGREVNKFHHLDVSEIVNMWKEATEVPRHIQLQLSTGLDTNSEVLIGWRYHWPREAMRLA